MDTQLKSTKRSNRIRGKSSYKMKSLGRIAFEEYCRVFQSSLNPEVGWGALDNWTRSCWEDVAAEIVREVDERRDDEN